MRPLQFASVRATPSPSARSRRAFAPHVGPSGRRWARSVRAALALGLLGLAAVSGVAHAQQPPPPPTTTPAAAPVAAEIIILHATNDGSGIDPKIGKMPQLGKPPFSSYNSYKLLERSKLATEAGKPGTIKLPSDALLAVTVKDVIAPKKKDEPIRYVVSASIKKPGGDTFLPLLEVNAKAGETFFVAGQNHKGGVLVVGIKIAP